MVQASAVRLVGPRGRRVRGVAACADQTDAMYDDSADGRAAAKRICATCELQAPCLAQALENRERDGVWGGTDAEERKRILRRRARAAG